MLNSMLYLKRNFCEQESLKNNARNYFFIYPTFRLFNKFENYNGNKNLIVHRKAAPKKILLGALLIF